MLPVAAAAAAVQHLSATAVAAAAAGLHAAAAAGSLHAAAAAAGLHAASAADDRAASAPAPVRAARERRRVCQHRRGTAERLGTVGRRLQRRALTVRSMEQRPALGPGLDPVGCDVSAVPTGLLAVDRLWLDLDLGRAVRLGRHALRPLVLERPLALAPRHRLGPGVGLVAPVRGLRGLGAAAAERRRRRSRGALALCARRRGDAGRSPERLRRCRPTHHLPLVATGRALHANAARRGLHRRSRSRRPPRALPHDHRAVGLAAPADRPLPGRRVARPPPPRRAPAGRGARLAAPARGAAAGSGGAAAHPAGAAASRPAKTAVRRAAAPRARRRRTTSDRRRAA